MLQRLGVHLSWGRILNRTAREFIADGALDLGAQQAYYFFFALFPALLTLISIAGFFPVGDVMGEIVKLMGHVVPPDVLKIINDQLAQIANSGKGGLLTGAFLLTLWSSSGAMVSIITTLNAAYDVTEGRSWWKVRLIAIALTVGIAFFILTSITLVIAGPAIAERLANVFGLGAAFKWTWWILQWPLVLALVITAIGLVYYFAPDVKQEWVWITPGAVLATTLWLALSLLFRLYVVNFGDYNETYGAIGAIIVLMTWLYLSSLAILFGAELNSEVEHASPYGKDPGEKVAGAGPATGEAADVERQMEAGELRDRKLPRPRMHALEPGERRPARLSDALIAAAALAPVIFAMGRDIRRRTRE